MSKVAAYGAWWVFAAEDVVTVLEDTDTYRKHASSATSGPPAPGSGVFGMGGLPSGLFGSDPPRHTEVRGVLEPLLLAAITDAPTVAQTVADDLLAKLVGTNQMELVDDYALPLPSSVLFTIMGIPSDHWPVLVQWVQAIATAHDSTQPPAIRMMGATCSMALDTYLAEWVLQHRAGNPVTGLLGGMCDAVDRGDLTGEDIQVVGNDLLVAGYLSTTFLIGTGVRHLLENPDQLVVLRERPDRIHDAVEEMLRIDAPAQLVDRVVATDTTLRGVALTSGDKVTAVLGSAGRDPSAFADPDRFDIDRDDRAQRSFGAGIHHCVGAPLVRLVAPVAIASLVSLPDLAIAGLPQWQTDPYLRAMTNIPLSFTAP